MKIELRHIEKKFPHATPLRDVSAEINDGDIIAVIGPSGTGKSTLLRCINLLDPPTGGQVIADGLDITQSKANFEKVRLRMGMVFQSFNLFGHLTVIENVMLALTERKHLPKQEAYDIAIEQLRAVGLAERALKYPEELSGGQKQRVSIARTLAMDPDLILLDEPTSALDPAMVREVESVICKLADTGKTMMIVTHEMRLAAAISNRIFYLDEGVLYEDGTPDEIFNHPKRERTRAFVNHLKVMKYRFGAGEFDYTVCRKKLDEFLDNNGVAGQLRQSMTGCIEKLAAEFLPRHLEEALPMSILCEYAADIPSARLLLYGLIEQAETRADLQSILSQICSEVKTEEITDEDYNCKISCEI